MSRFDKARIANRFGQAAHQYDRHADFQRLTGDRLLGMLGDAVWPVGLDLGSGTGWYTRELARRHQCQLGLDIAPGMLSHARASYGAEIHWLNGDAEHLPLADASVDRVFSNLALQWCDDLRTPLAELYRVVRPGGEVFLTTLVEGSLQELANAWQSVDQHQHSNRFIPRATLEDWLGSLPFSQVDCQIRAEVMEYPHLHDLTRSLKGIGANHVHGQGQTRHSRTDLKQLVRGYEAFRQANGLLPATYQVAYIHLIR